MAALKIGLVVPGYQADAADWCIPALTNLVRALAARPDIALHVFTLRYPPRRAVYRLHGATIHAFGGAPFGSRRIRGASLARLWAEAAAAIRAEHRRAPFAVLHGFWATESGWVAAATGRALGIPTLVHLAGGELTWDAAVRYGNRRPGLARLLVAGSLRLATHITVPSTPLARQLRRHYPTLARKAVPWAFGVDRARFAPPPVPADPPTPSALRLVHAASLVPVKDQMLLLDGLAAARAAAPEISFTLTIAGAGPLRTALAARAARADLAGAVRFAGEVRHDALPALYHTHDVFVLTSRHEAQCLAVLEAAACGLPWIGPPVGALADLAGEAPPSGWCVAPADPATLAAALRAAAAPGERARRGVAALAAVARDYDLLTQTERLIGLYREAGAASRRANW